MMNLIKLMAFGLVMFAVTAGGSWFAMSKQHAAAITADDEHATTDEHAPAETLRAETSHGPATGTTHSAPAQHHDEEELPVVVRPKMSTPEDILRNAMSLKAREEKLVQRERAAEQEAMRLGLVQSDLQGEQVTIEALAADVKMQIESANQLLTRIYDEKSSLDRERLKNADEMKKFEDTKTEMNDLERQNLKQLSTWIQGMDSAAAAAFIKELSNDGKMDVAVQMLVNFEEREASKILAALNDPELMADLAEKFRTLQRPTKTATNRK
jgi:hypothetical protein